MNLIYSLIISTILIQACNEQDKKAVKIKTENEYALLTYGLPNMERQNSRNVVAKKWGIKFKPVAGCVVTKSLTDSVRTVNQRVNKNIEDKYGRNWSDKFEKEIDEEFEKENIITTTLDKVDFIKKKNDQMDLEGNGLHYYMTPIENSTEYNVSVEGWGTVENKDTWVSYYRMTVNYKTKKYELIDDKIEKRE